MPMIPQRLSGKEELQLLYLKEKKILRVPGMFPQRGLHSSFPSAQQALPLKPTFS